MIVFAFETCAATAAALRKDGEEAHVTMVVDNYLVLQWRDIR